MANSTSLFGIAVPSGWTDILVRAVKAAIVAFVVLQMKEWFDAGQFDTAGTSADAAMIAGGTIVLNAILRLAR
jgi:lipid A disaccharide synthetase